ncbi:hypothetical protein [Streptomyces luteireticuli]|uniref:MarR family transcriptional regulator n=1 Tax=Streptomyces luteireticuli TaxID=173858 RepID=A0ABN0Z9L2_9ACTN
MSGDGGTGHQDAGVVQAQAVLSYFVRELTHAGTVRLAAPDGDGGWVNEYPPPVRRLDVVEPGRPVAVHLYARRRGVRRCVLPLGDFDASRATADQARADAEEYAAALEAEGIAPVPAASGGGGTHVWSGCTEGFTLRTAQRIARAAKRLWVTFDGSPLTNPQYGAGRPPGAPHRKGGHSRLTRHTIEEAVSLLGPRSARAEAYERLAVRLEAMAAARPALLQDGAEEETDPAADDHQEQAAEAGTVPRSILERGPVVRELVTDAHGHLRLNVRWRPLGDAALKGLCRRLLRWVDHDVQVHAVLRSMALAGWTHAEAFAVVRDAESSPALEWLRTRRTSADGPREPRTKDQTRALFDRKWRHACQDAARMPRRPEDDADRPPTGEVAAAVLDLMARMRAAGTARWARQSGPADAALLMALCWLMLVSGTTDVSADVRRLGVLAGYTPQTANTGLHRLIRDGWIAVTAEAERRAGRARRVTFATRHECTGHKRHVCAIYDATSQVTTGATGSDRSENAAPPPSLAPPVTDLPAYLRAVVTRQQADVWHEIGHHAARTLQAVTTARHPLSIPALLLATGYRRATVLKHVTTLESLGLVSTGRTRAGHLRVRAGQGSLYEAAEATGTAGRMARIAVDARVDHHCHLWQLAEEEWSALSHAEKCERGRRRGPDQMVLPGMSPTARAYPRHPHPRTGTPEAGPMDHARAARIEAERINAPALLANALRLAKAGALIDPVRLTAEEPPAEPAQPRVRAVLPARQACPLCAADPGHPCVTSRGERAAGWHAARRQAARAALGTTTTPAAERAARPPRHRPPQHHTTVPAPRQHQRHVPAAPATTAGQLPLLGQEDPARHTDG